MIYIALIFSLLATLFTASLAPQVNLLFFAPFFVYLFYKKPLIFCLWTSLLCGVVLDLLSAQQRFGLYAINFCITTALLYQQKRNFFEDSLSTIPILTFLFSVVSTCLQVILLFVFDKGIPLSWEWAGSDLILMPLLDAFYGFALFSLPSVGKKKQNA